ncbi:hypothetical protein ACXWPT_09535, partial [Streptococcus pyogenes]
ISRYVTTLFLLSPRSHCVISFPGSSHYVGQINEALGQQGIRMDKAASEEKKRKTAVADSRKRPSSAAESSDNKRIKLENSAPP